MDPEFWTMFGVGSAVLGVIAAVVGTVLASVCTIVPIGLVGWWIYSRYRRSQNVRQASQAWLATQGQILQSRVEVYSGGHGANVNPVVIYQYQVNGQFYQGNQVRAGDSVMRIQSGRDPYLIVDRYPVGSTVAVYYNPANPAEAALER